MTDAAMADAAAIFRSILMLSVSLSRGLARRNSEISKSQNHIAYSLAAMC